MKPFHFTTASESEVMDEMAIDPDTKRYILTSHEERPHAAFSSEMSSMRPT
jgi:hypothetical protein